MKFGIVVTECKDRYLSILIAGVENEIDCRNRGEGYGTIVAMKVGITKNEVVRAYGNVCEIVNNANEQRLSLEQLLERLNVSL